MPRVQFPALLQPFSQLYKYQLVEQYSLNRRVRTLCDLPLHSPIHLQPYVANWTYILPVKG